MGRQWGSEFLVAGPGLAAVKVERGDWGDSGSKGPKTLALHQPDSTQIAQISPFYESFSLDRGGWPLILTF